MKRAIECRAETGDYIRAFSISQFHKNHKLPEVVALLFQTSRNYLTPTILYYIDTVVSVFGGAVVRALDLQLEVAGSIPAAALFSATLDKLFTHIVQRLWCYNLMALYKSV